MAVLLPNATLNTARNPYSSGTGTGTPQSHLQGIITHMGEVHASAFKVLPAAAFEANFQAEVDTGTDIKLGDQVVSILLPDGITLWPGFSSNEFYQVSYIHESDPGPLAHRTVYIKRIVGGGPSY